MRMHLYIYLFLIKDLIWSLFSAFPCLSFDLIYDDLGEKRECFPMSFSLGKSWSTSKLNYQNKVQFLGRSLKEQTITKSIFQKYQT